MLLWFHNLYYKQPFQDSVPTWVPFSVWAAAQLPPSRLKSKTCPVCSNLGAPAKYREALSFLPTEMEYPATVTVTYNTKCHSHEMFIFKKPIFLQYKAILTVSYIAIYHCMSPAKINYFNKGAGEMLMIVM